MSSKFVRRALICGLSGSSVLVAACAAGPSARRRDALWAEYRSSARVADRYADGATLFAEAKALDRAALVEAVLARNPDVAATREGLRAALAKADQAGALDEQLDGGFHESFDSLVGEAAASLHRGVAPSRDGVAAGAGLGLGSAAITPRT